METKNVGPYIAEIAVLSEVCSIVQSIINVAGGDLSYINLIVFFFLCLPILGRVRVPRELFVLIGGLLFFVTAKLLIQGVGTYYQKALVIVLFIPVYAILFKQVLFSDITNACKKYRYLILLLGGFYVCMWYFLGGYRNASTVTIFLMLLLGFSHMWAILPTLILALVMKTQYKIWGSISFFSFLFKHQIMRMCILFITGIAAAIFPLILVSIDLSWTSFSLSELSSLEERLKEVRSFIYVVGGQVEVIGFGWPIGQPIYSDGLSERGYMHSAYLWLFGTLGLPVTAVMFSYLFFKQSSSRKVFFVRIFLAFSNSLTFLILTNPFSTALMFADDKKKTD